MSQAHPERSGQPVAPDQPPYAQQPQVVEPKVETLVSAMNQRLDMKAAEVRRLEESETRLAAVCSDLQNENNRLLTALSAHREENLELRKRLGLDDNEPVLTAQNGSDAADAVT